jgi:hypothetical protein
VATKLVKVHDVDEARRLWKAGLLVNCYGDKWAGPRKEYPICVLQNVMWQAYMLVDSDDEE